MNLDPTGPEIGARCSIDSTAFISPFVKMGNDCRIGSGSRLVGKVRLGNRVWVDSNVAFYGDVKIGDRVYIGSNSTLGHYDRKNLKKMIAGVEASSLAKGSRLQIGEDCTIRQGCIVYSSVKIGSRVEFGHNVLVRENVVIGDRTLVGTGVVIDGESSIGRDVSIQTGVYVSRRSKVGDRVFLGPRCILLNDKYMMLRKSKLRGPIVGNDSAIGGNATLMPGVRVGSMAVVGSGAVVTYNVPDKTVCVGVPAKKIKKTPKDWRTLLGQRS